MRVIALAREELVLLSMFHGKPYNSFSIMKELNTYKDAESIVSKEQYIKTTRRFVEDGLLGFDPGKKLGVTRETQLLFEAINAPQKTFVINNSLKPQVGTVYYCEKKGFAVLLTVSPDEKFCVINFPFNREMLGHWLDEEVIGDLEVTKEAFEVEAYELSDHGYIHFMTLVSFANFLRTLPKHDPNLSFSLDALENPAFLNGFTPFEPIGVDKVKIGQMMSQDGAHDILEELIGLGLVIKESDKYRIRKSVSDVLNTKVFRNVINFHEKSPFGRSKTLYATDCGYLLMEQVLYEPTTIKIKVMPLTTDPVVMMEDILKFSDMRLTEEMKRTLEAKLKPTT